MFGPSKNDVLCGRGGLSNNHAGNRLFRRLVNRNKVLYQNSLSPTHKQMVALSIVEAIRNAGGRFIRKQNGEWMEISTRDAAVKTSQALRETIDNSDSSSSSSSQSNNSPPRSKEMRMKEKNYCNQNMPCRSTFVATACPSDDFQENVDHSSFIMVYSDDSESSQSSHSPADCDDVFEGGNLEPLSLCHATTSFLTPEFRDFLAEVSGLMESQGTSHVQNFVI